MLKIRSLSKRFGGIYAVNDVSFDVPLGSIVALIGPNGAGKTTTFDLISGLTTPDKGEVAFFDQKITGLSPNAICRAGIARTFQISQLFDTLTVRENVLTAALFGKGRHTDAVAANRRTDEWLATFSLSKKANEVPKDLTFAERRNVEIVRALVMDPKILLLDEVLAGLTATEIEGAIQVLEKVKNPNIGILLVEHQMRAVMRLADTVVVMMGGSVLVQGPPNEIRNHPKVLSAYLGEAIDETGLHSVKAPAECSVASDGCQAKKEPGKPMLLVTGLQAGYGPLAAVHKADLEVRENEIVALIGSNGMGKTTALKAISGVLQASAGRIQFLDEDITSLPSHLIMRRGLCQVPEGRQLFRYMSVEDNLLLGAGFVDEAWHRRDETLKEVFTLFPRLAERRAQRAGRLSGGEQQMVAIARALMGRPKLLMLDEPTIGLAPIVVAETFEAISRINAAGVSVLLVEQNVGWALRISHRVYVMETGKIVLEEEANALRENRNFLRSFGLEE
jgi:branched-chain amino acid transport system ATP-binding protein